MALNPYLMPDMSVGRVPPEVLRYPSQVDFLLLTPHVGVTLTIPAGANYVLFTPANACDIFVKYNANTLTSSLYRINSVSSPGTICSGLAAEQISTASMRSLAGMTKIGLIAPANATVTMAWYG
jgi:hypothetical protein